MIEKKEKYDKQNIDMCVIIIVRVFKLFISFFFHPRIVKESSDRNIVLFVCFFEKKKKTCNVLGYQGYPICITCLLTKLVKFAFC